MSDQPTADMTERESLVSSFAEHLSTLHTSLWGRAWDVDSDDGRRRAAEWLVEQIDGWEVPVHEEHDYGFGGHGAE